MRSAPDRLEFRFQTQRSALVGALITGIIALAAPAAAQTYTCQATSAAADALCGNPEFQGCLMDVDAPDSSGTLITDQRHFCIHVPEVFTAQSLPVVFGFHGSGGNGGRMVALWENQTEQGMVLVFPSALPTNRVNPTQSCDIGWRTIDGEHPDWSDFEDMDICANPVSGNQTPYGHDLAMVASISNDIVAQGIVPQGLYAAGFSSGANMIQQLFITERSALAFDGFATSAIGLGGPKIDAMTAIGSGPYQPNPGIRRPILVSAGTSDKSFVPWGNFIDGINEQIATGDCPATMTLVEEFVACYRKNETFAGLGRHAMINSIEATLDWFVTHNASSVPAVEGLYPDLGHGSSFRVSDDITLAVRQDFRSDPAIADSAAVAGITILHGRHNWPGSNGNAPPCISGNCDINLTEEILQFWRANAGFISEWP